MTATRSPLRLSVTLFGSVAVLLHLLGWFFPSGVNWGFHHLAFLSVAPSALLIVLMISGLVPQVQAGLIALLDGWAKVGHGGKGALWILSLIILAVLFWMFRQQTFFLGDGYLVIRNLSLVRSVADLPSPFPTAPLSAFIALQLEQLLTALNIGFAAQLAWQIQSVAFGVLAFPVAFRLARSLTDDARLWSMFALFILAGGASQLFFGYVETYPPAYVATMVFIWLSLDFLKGRVPFLLPSLAFGLLFSFHFGMLSLIPALGFLFVVGIRRRGFVHAVVALGATIVCTALVLWMCGYTPTRFVDVLFKGSSYSLPLTASDDWQAAYSLFSFWHVVDLINDYVLLSPFTLLLVPMALVMCLKRESMKRLETTFLLLAVLGAAAWTFMTNFEVGMSRDWDVLAPLSVCVVALALYGWGEVDRAGASHSLLAGIVVVTLLHSAAWVMVNADEDRSIARFAMLQDSRLRSQRAIAYACEDLAGFYRERKQYVEAIPFIERTVAIDSTNARRWLSFANTYQLAGQNENAMRAYEQSAKHGIQDKAAFFNLGVLYYNRGRLDEAIASLRQAATIDPTDTLISSNLALMLKRKAAGNPIRP